MWVSVRVFLKCFLIVPHIAWNLFIFCQNLVHRLKSVRVGVEYKMHRYWKVTQFTQPLAQDYALQQIPKIKVKTVDTYLRLSNLWVLHVWGTNFYLLCCKSGLQINAFSKYLANVRILIEFKIRKFQWIKPKIQKRFLCLFVLLFARNNSRIPERIFHEIWFLSVCFGFGCSRKNWRNFKHDNLH